jgi:hypothetical protein
MIDRIGTVVEDNVTENLANVLTLLGLAASFLVGATAILVLALASKIVRETKK